MLPLKGTAAVSGPVASSTTVELLDGDLFIPQNPYEDLQQAFYEHKLASRDRF